MHRVVLTSTAYTYMYGRVYGLYWYELNSNQIQTDDFVVSPPRNDRSVSISMMENAMVSPFATTKQTR